ncbi:MAG: cation:proton antiporter [Candidatus Hydrogenedentes bacterium]|nr:cation:proton antiporter [Candidatus Hydrogenedentota bacterium]
MDLSGLNLSPLTLMGAVAVLGLYAGRGSKWLRMPSLIGYMILGVLLGPSILNVLTESVSEGLGFITEVALGFVAFSIGAELSLSSLKRLGYGIISIILVESFLAFAIVAIAIYLLTDDLVLALIFGSMAPASAPAGTVAVIQEYKAKGKLTDALYAVVGFDDGLAIIIFGFAAAVSKSLLVAEATGTAAGILPALADPAIEVGLSLLVGTIIGFLFCQLVRKLNASHDLFIIVFGAVLIATGLSIRWHLSLILTNLVLGFVLVNTRNETLVRRVMAPVLEIMPLLFILFFCLAGAHLELRALPALGLVGIVYIAGRSAGLLSGAWLGATIGRADEKLRKYLGLGILSQAGVAIGLALIVRQEFAQLAEEYDLEHAAYVGASVLSTITATSIFFELIGPILTKFALGKAGEIGESAPKN